MKDLLKLVISFLFLIWFIGSVAGMIIVSRRPENIWLLPVLLGQFFMVFGIIGTAALCTSKKKGVWLPLIFVFTGAAVITLSLIYHYGSKDTRSEVIRSIPVLIGAYMTFAGGFTAIFKTVGRKRSKEKYTVPIEGVCTEHKIHTGSKGSVLRSPVYEIFLNGETVTLEKEVYSGIGVPEKGETRTLYIDPDDLGDYAEPIFDKKNDLLCYILSISFIAAGAVVMIAGSMM